MYHGVEECGKEKVILDVVIKVYVEALFSKQLSREYSV